VQNILVGTMTNPSDPAGKEPHELSPAEVAAQFGSDLHKGLSSSEAQDRLARFGPNALPDTVRRSPWLRLLREFRDVQVYLLLAAALASLVIWAMEQERGLPYEAFAILAIVLLNAVFGFLQEAKADRALAALRTMTPVEASVIRDSNEQRILVQKLVPGDLLIIREGDRIAADARLIELTAFRTHEAALTGESAPVQKTIEALPHGTPSTDRYNMVLSGTLAVSGHAKAVVTSTGSHTEFGGIAQLLRQTEERETPLQKELNQLGKKLGLFVVLIAFAVVTSLLLLHGAPNGSVLMRALIFGVALAVAATPEGLAAIVTIVLALGVQRMARRGAVVRHLHAVETLGEATVIASDKTGTMTLNQMTARVVVTASGRAIIPANGYSPDGSWTLPENSELQGRLRGEVTAVLKAAALANNATLRKIDGNWRIHGDPTEGALLVAGAKSGIDLAELEQLYPRVGEMPFSSERKRMSTIHLSSADRDGDLFGSFALLTKGAPDLLLERCTHEVIAGQRHPLTEKRKREILETLNTMAAEALRTLGVAMKLLPDTTALPEPVEETLEQDLTFLGLIGLIDPPRPEAREAVAKAAMAGIRTIMITGDHAGTALAIARNLGITASEVVITSKDLATMPDDELALRSRHVSVFARINPGDKLRIVHALQANGEIVAMTGDGVNDAPALKAADIGIAMGLSGTDVAKEAADLVLTDDNFATIVAAIEEGRGLFDNIRKFLRYLLATNSGEILTLFIGVILTGSAIGAAGQELVLPLLAVQILWVNLVTDGAPALALGLDPSASDIMHRAPVPAEGKIVDRLMLADIGIVATVVAAGTLWAFCYHADTQSMELRRSLAFTTLILFQLFNSFEARSSLTSGFINLFQNKWLWATIALAVALQLLLLNLAPLQRAFGVVALSPAQWLRCTLVATSVLWIMEAVKWVRRHELRRRSSKYML